MGRLYTIRSKWDYLAFVAPLQWIFVVLNIALAANGVNNSIPALMIVLLNTTSIVAVPLAVHFGGKHHDHMNPGFLYYVGAVFLAPIVGVHYLSRTRIPDDELLREQPQYSSSK